MRMRNLAPGLLALSVTLFGNAGAHAQTAPFTPPQSPTAAAPQQPASPPDDYATRGRPEIPNYASAGGQAPGTARGDQRVPDLRYWACDGVNFLPRYTARWQGNGFILSRI